MSYLSFPVLEKQKLVSENDLPLVINEEDPNFFPNISVAISKSAEVTRWQLWSMQILVVGWVSSLLLGAGGPGF